MFHVRAVPSVFGAFSWRAGSFEDCDRSREGLTQALAKHTLGGKFCIFSDVSLASGWQCVSLPSPYSCHVAPTWLSWITLGWFTRAFGEEGSTETVGSRGWGEVKEAVFQWRTGPGEAARDPPWIFTACCILGGQKGFSFHRLPRAKDV